MKAQKLTGKLLTAILCVMLFLSAVVCQFTVKPAFADTTTTVYFKVGGNNYSSTYTNHAETDVPVLRLDPAGSNEVTAKYQRKLAVNDMGLSFYIADELESVCFDVVTSSYYANSGDKDTVTTKFHLGKSTDGAKLNLSVNEGETVASVDYNKDTAINLEISVNDEHKLVAKFEGQSEVAVGEELVEDFDKTMADVTLHLNYKDDANLENTTGVEFVYIDQMLSDAEHDHRQTFELNGTTLKEHADAVIDLKDTFAKMQDGVLTLVQHKSYTVSYTAYSVTNQSAATEINADEAVAQINASSKKVVYNTLGEHTLEIKSTTNETVYATYTVNVVEAEANYGDEDLAAEFAPVYTEGKESDAYKAFTDALYDATRKEYDVEQADGTTVKEERSIRVGTSQYLTIPSLKDLVFDSVSPYANLDYTVYYAKVDGSTDFASTSSYRVPVTEAGKYIFFVVFEDEFGNAMDKELFYKEVDGVYTTEGCLYADYVFEFEVFDDAPRAVTGGKQSTWYKGVKNTATKFDIESASYDDVYKLYYKNGETWVEILTYDEANDEGFYTEYYVDTANGLFTDEDIASIAYDGELTFTPNKTGEYKIVCSVHEKNSAVVTEGETIIKVSEVSVVVPKTETFFETNLWSIIFLGVGALALVGLIVVLFIKPKEEN